MDILVSNSGSRAGTVRYPVILAIDTKSVGTISIPLEFSGVISPAALLEAGKSQLLIFNVNKKHEFLPVTVESVTTLLNFDRTNGRAVCTLTVSTTDFAATTSQDHIGIKCLELNAFISGVDWKL